MLTPLAFLGSLGTQEIVLILCVLLLLFGAKKLPELARGIGKSMGEFKKAKDEFENELHTSVKKAEQNSGYNPESQQLRQPAGRQPSAQDDNNNNQA